MLYVINYIYLYKNIFRCLDMGKGPIFGLCAALLLAGFQAKAEDVKAKLFSKMPTLNNLIMPYDNLNQTRISNLQDIPGYIQKLEGKTPEQIAEIVLPPITLANDFPLFYIKGKDLSAYLRGGIKASFPKSDNGQVDFSAMTTLELILNSPALNKSHSDFGDMMHKLYLVLGMNNEFFARSKDLRGINIEKTLESFPDSLPTIFNMFEHSHGVYVDLYAELEFDEGTDILANIGIYDFLTFSSEKSPTFRSSVGIKLPKIEIFGHETGLRPYGILTFEKGVPYWGISSEKYGAGVGITLEGEQGNALLGLEADIDKGPTFIGKFCLN